MAFRDDRDALKHKAEDLEAQLKAAQAEIDRNRDEAGRAARLEQELAQAREMLQRIEAQLPARAPRASASRVGLFVGGAVALAGLGGFLLLRAEPAPVPPPVASVAAVSPPAVQAPAPLATLPKVSPVAPPSPPVTAQRVRWPAKVKTATGLPLAKGAACSIDAVLRASKPHEVTVSCGAEILYRSTDKLEGMAHMSSGAGEQPGLAKDTAQARLKWDDVGARTGPRTQASLDTSARAAVAFRETAPAFRVELDVATWSEPYPRDNSDLAFSTRVAQKAKVSSVAGAAPLKVGTACDVLLEPHYDPRHNCRAVVSCSGRTLYGAPGFGFSNCETKDGEPVAFRDETHGGDPVLRWDLVTGGLELVVQVGDQEWSAKLTTSNKK